MKKVLAFVATAVVSITSFSQVKEEKPYYINLEVNGGVAFDKYVNTAAVSSSTLAFGYRFSHLCTIAGGAGLEFTSNSKNPSVSIPLFVRARVEFIDARVSPYMDFDLGYSFVLVNQDFKKGESIKRNSEVLTYRLLEKGYDSDVSLIDYCNNEKLWKKEGYKSSEEWESITGKSLEELTMETLQKFSNGSNKYLDIQDAQNWFATDGLFVKATFGVCGKVGSHQINFGVGAGLQQFMNGCWVTPRFGKSQIFARYDNLCGINNERGQIVVTEGRDPFFKRFKPTVFCKLGFTF